MADRSHPGGDRDTGHIRLHPERGGAAADPGRPGDPGHRRGIVPNRGDHGPAGVLRRGRRRGPAGSADADGRQHIGVRRERQHRHGAHQPLRAAHAVRLTHATGPTHRCGPGPSTLQLLIGLLALFGGLRAAACRFGFGFLLRGIALSLGLVLLGLALLDEITAARHRADGFFRLALDVLDDALQAFLRPAFLRHGFLPHRLTFPAAGTVSVPPRYSGSRRLESPNLLTDRLILRELNGPDATWTQCPLGAVNANPDRVGRARTAGVHSRRIDFAQRCPSPWRHTLESWPPKLTPAGS